MTYEMAPFPMTLHDLLVSFHLVQTFSKFKWTISLVTAVVDGKTVSQTIVINSHTAYYQLNEIFNWYGASRGPSATAVWVSRMKSLYLRGKMLLHANRRWRRARCDCSLAGGPRATCVTKYQDCRVSSQATPTVLLFDSKHSSSAAARRHATINCNRLEIRDCALATCVRGDGRGHF